LKMPEAEVAARCLVGPAEECVAKIQQFVDAGCTKFVLRPSCPTEQVMGQIEAYAKSILPCFN
jgi:alkanesulfonate monooxygenase SsuD/methylene tetrahydromethanopterin reductase-like flavin-dependent oxidoreductase (luciferase family)